MSAKKPNVNGLNGGGNGQEPGDGPENDGPPNIVSFPSLADRDRLRRAREEQAAAGRPAAPPRQPLINLPPVTKAMIALFVALHAGLALLSPDLRIAAIGNFSFIPARYTGHLPFHVWAIAAPITYAFLHGGWLHVTLNSVMMAALGTGTERWLGGGRMLVLFVLCSIAGALCQFILSPTSPAPVVGASAGISGLFAAVIVMMQRLQSGPAQPRSLLPFILVWIVVSVAFGMMGGPDGSSVAWAAHIGGFLAGFVFLRPMLARR